MAWRYRLISVLVIVAGMGVGSMLAQDPADAQPPAAQAPAADAQAGIQPAPDSDLAAEVQQLRAEVDQLKNQLAQLNSVIEQLQTAQTAQAVPAKVAPAPAKGKRTAPAAAKKNAPTPPVSASPAAAEDANPPLTVLVFLDGHRTEARNYAIVGQTLWIYTEDDSKKMPLSELDVAATKSANSDRGIVFQVPQTK